MDIKKIYNNYKDIIVCCLICIFFINQCQLKLRNRRYNYWAAKIQIETDSINSNNINIIDSLNGIIDKQRDSIRILNIESNALINNINLLKNSNDVLRSNNVYYQKTNNTLIQTNKEIINKDN